MIPKINRKNLSYLFGLLMSLFTIAEVNYPMLQETSRLSLFALFGLALCYLNKPILPRLPECKYCKLADFACCLLTVLCFGYFIVQSEPGFRNFWPGGISLGDRAGEMTRLDLGVGAVTFLLVIEAARRSVGFTLPILSLLFVAYGYFGSFLPDWLFPHRGYSAARILEQTVLQSQGILGIAMRVMFTYVFLFVIFGAFLTASGATQFIIDFAQKVFGGSPAGPANVAVLSSGMMGSLSGSAVANTATTGTFTIPMMRSSGFDAKVAAGISAAASSGGALMPPVMGAGAFMMLEVIGGGITYLQIIKAALLPALLYYFSLFMIVHFYSRKIRLTTREKPRDAEIHVFSGVIFFSSIASLILFLVLGFSAARAVTYSLALILVLAAFHRNSRVGLKASLDACARAGRDVLPLVAAAACVGIVIGIVLLTGIGSKMPEKILSLAGHSLLAALVLIMVSSIILGMGLPSAICYLLLATMVGPALGKMGVVTLSAHLFIFYFGMMSMVTPPVALAAYTAASIAKTDIIRTAFAAFRFALVGFTLPYMFVFQPALLMLDPQGGPAPAWDVVLAVVVAVLGIIPFAAGIAGYLFRPMGPLPRVFLFAAAGLLLIPGPVTPIGGVQIKLFACLGLALLAGAGLANWKAKPEGQNL